MLIIFFIIDYFSTPWWLSLIDFFRCFFTQGIFSFSSRAFIYDWWCRLFRWLSFSCRWCDADVDYFSNISISADWWWRLLHCIFLSSSIRCRHFSSILITRAWCCSFVLTFHFSSDVVAVAFWFRHFIEIFIISIIFIFFFDDFFFSHYFLHISSLSSPFLAVGM